MSDSARYPGLTDAQRRDWLRLIRSQNVGPRTFRELLNRFGGARAALAALPELSRRGGRDRLKICDEDDADAELERLDELGASLLTLADPEYPPLLRQISDPPPVLTVFGTVSMLTRPTIAIVGARNASALGRKMATMLARDLGAAGQVIVSGLARGIDATAHRAALDTGTVAVCAGGIDVIYPPENASLAESIAESGVLVSEIAAGIHPQRTHFPRRNRLVSGLASGTIVIDAAARSGSLITARFALEQNREVFAVPGSPLDPRAAGGNALIRDGATLIRGADDVLEALKPMVRTLTARRQVSGADLGFGESETQAPEAPADSVRSRTNGLLSVSPVEIDELVRSADASVGDVMGVLLELELAGRLVRFSGQRVALKP